MEEGSCWWIVGSEIRGKILSRSRSSWGLDENKACRLVLVRITIIAVPLRAGEFGVGVVDPLLIATSPCPGAAAGLPPRGSFDDGRPTPPCGSLMVEVV